MGRHSLARVAARVALALSLFPSSLARSAGFEFPDHGTAALGAGGAYVAAAADPTAIYYNPAGVAWLEGANVLLDSNLSFHDVSFRRKEGTYKSGCASGTCVDTNKDSVPKLSEVTNTAGGFFGPFLGATYSLKLACGGNLGFGVGVYGPSAIGKYAYAKPNYDPANFDESTNQFKDDPRRSAPQRYSLIDSSVLIVYPTVTAAYRHNDFLSIGGSLQYVIFDTAFSQSVTDWLPDQFQNPDHPKCNAAEKGTCGPDRMRDEDPYADSLVSLQAKGGAIKKVTGILGVKARLTPSIVVGASFRPGFRMRGDGTMKLGLSRLAKQVNAEITGDTASLELNLPNHGRLGVQVKVMDGLTVEVDGVYEGWSTVDKFVITPKDIKVKLLGVERALAPIIVDKVYKDAYSGRLGVEYKLPLTLPFSSSVTLRGGFFYETSAIPLESTNLDFANWDRTGETVGLSLSLPPVELRLAAAFLQQPTREVTNSNVLGVGSDEALKPFVVGNGTYNAGYRVFSAGLVGRF
jgi:long-chain fatty acid transport protein